MTVEAQPELRGSRRPAFSSPLSTMAYGFVVLPYVAQLVLYSTNYSRSKTTLLHRLRLCCTDSFSSSKKPNSCFSLSLKPETSVTDIFATSTARREESESNFLPSFLPFLPLVCECVSVLTILPFRFEGGPFLFSNLGLRPQQEQTRDLLFRLRHGLAFLSDPITEHESGEGGTIAILKKQFFRAPFPGTKNSAC